MKVNYNEQMTDMICKGYALLKSLKSVQFPNSVAFKHEQNFLILLDLCENDFF